MKSNTRSFRFEKLSIIAGTCTTRKRGPHYGGDGRMLKTDGDPPTRFGRRGFEKLPDLPLNKRPSIPPTRTAFATPLRISDGCGIVVRLSEGEVSVYTNRSISSSPFKTAVTIPAVTREKKVLSNRYRLQHGVQIDPSLKILFRKKHECLKATARSWYLYGLTIIGRGRFVARSGPRQTQTISTRKKDDRREIFFIFSHNFVWTYYRYVHSTPGKWRRTAAGGSASGIIVRITRNYENRSIRIGLQGEYRPLEFVINHTTVFGTLSMCPTAIVLNTFDVVFLADPVFSYLPPVRFLDLVKGLLIREFRAKFNRTFTRSNN